MRKYIIVNVCKNASILTKFFLFFVSWYAMTLRENEIMPKSVRINEKTEKRLYQQMIKNNQKLADLGKRPIRETDIVHFLLGYIEKVRITDEGELHLNDF